MAFTGFRRRWRIEPGEGAVTAALEDDIHCMAVTLRHDGETIWSVEAVMDRWPWHTCPGAEVVVRETFTDVKLAEVARRGEKQANCTHLYDLALLAAGHAGDAAATHYDAWVGDPADGQVDSWLLRGGEEVLRWTLRDDVLQAPLELACTHVMKLRDWIATLDPATQEAARLLQWATLIAHGRWIPIEAQSDASRMPSTCYTFQPERKFEARRIGEVLDFSEDSAREPLSHFDGARFSEQANL